MRQEIILPVAILLATSSAAPLKAREVPQELSHQKILITVQASLQANNPDGITDPVFGLLGNAAGSKGQGKITDTDCLQQATADQAFSNAKAAGDVAGMVAALQYRALERNTGSVGLKSVSCTAIKAKNPEIAAIQQHQDPASDGAAAANKAIVLEVAKQIAAVGGDPLLALETGTFAPGKIGDPTAAGNTCDVADDKTGCIFTQKKLVNDATADEIKAAVGGAGAGGAAQGNAGQGNANQGNAGQANAGEAANNNNQGAAQQGGEAAAAAPLTGPDSAACKAKKLRLAKKSKKSKKAKKGKKSKKSTKAAGDQVQNKAAGGLDFGSCADPSITFGNAPDRQEPAFFATDSATFNHGSALNIKVISEFIAQQLGTKCGAGQATVDAAKAASDKASALKGQAAADAFNGALGVQGAAAANNNNQAAANTQNNNGDAAKNNEAGAGAANNAGGALDFGSCADPGITFGAQPDRPDISFGPRDKATFKHGSALNIKVITDSITNELNSQCKAPQATIDAAKAASATANGLKGQAAADAWNNALGV